MLIKKINLLKLLRRSARLALLLCTICYGLPTAYAATLSLDPAEGSYGPGDMFLTVIRIETEPGECINAAQVELLYPSDWLKAVAISKGESLLTLWPEEPIMDQEHGRVTLSGGIPAGYCGRVQGDPGKTNILAKVAFTIPGMMVGGKTATGPIPMELSFSSSSRVLLNDGFGSPAPLTLVGARLTRAMSSAGIKNEWLDIVHGDEIPPDEFTASIESDKSVFGGKYFVVFATVDKQSGVDHYEVTEDDPENIGFVRGTTERAVAIKAVSPYMLSDQELKSRIIVRAIDAAGNAQQSLLPPTKGALSRSPDGGDDITGLSGLMWGVIGGVGLLVAFLVRFLLLRRKR